MSYRLLHLDLVNLDAVKFVFKLVVENESVSVVDVSTLQQHENHQPYDWERKQQETGKIPIDRTILKKLELINSIPFAELEEKNGN